MTVPRETMLFVGGVAELKQRIACCETCGDKGIVVLERGGWRRPPVLERCVCVPF